MRCGKGVTHRRLPIPAPARRALREYLEARQDMDPDDPLWVGQKRLLTAESGIYRTITNYACLGPPHSAAHLSIRYLEANPGDLRGLASLLGRASLNAVMAYAEPTSGALAERVERMEQVWERGWPICRFRRVMIVLYTAAYQQVVSPYGVGKFYRSGIPPSSKHDQSIRKPGPVSCGGIVAHSGGLGPPPAGPGGDEANCARKEPGRLPHPKS